VVGKTKSSTAYTKFGAADSKNVKGAFMREFFEAIGVIQETLNEGRANVKLMGVALEDSLQATTTEKSNAIGDRINQLVEETSDLTKASSSGIQDLKDRSEGPEASKCSAAEAKIQKNMQQAMVKKHQQLLQDFQKAQEDFKKSLERRQQREMQILMPHATEEERRRMTEAGETTSLMVAKKMAGAHALLLDEVQRICDKNQDILRLEQSIADLASMFSEMAVLVDAQGEMLDNIEMHVHKAKDCTAKAEQNLITTRKVQYKNKKNMCCMMVVMMIIALVIMAPMLVKE